MDTVCLTELNAKFFTVEVVNNIDPNTSLTTVISLYNGTYIALIQYPAEARHISRRIRMGATIPTTAHPDPADRDLTLGRGRQRQP